MMLVEQTEKLVEQTEKLVPFVTNENALGQNVTKLVSGVDIFDSDLRVENDLKIRDT